MSRGWEATVLVAAVCLLFPTRLPGQTLAIGNWRGSLRLPDDDSLTVTLTAARVKDRMQLDIRAASGLSWGLGSLRERPGRVDFSWALDSPEPLLCRISFRRADLWEGYCDDTVRGADGKFLRLLLTIWRADSHQDAPG